MRDRHKADFQARYGIALTYLPFVTRATVEALRTYPLLNASIEGNNIVYHNEINIGIAVALENGLIVPVIRNADEKNVLGLQRAIVDLAARARSRQLKPDEVLGGTFSITNFGGYGSVIATPIINQPQVAILGVGAVEKVPVVVDDAIAIRSVCYLSLSFDHRIVDGALADQFTAKVKAVLEDWSEEVLYGMADSAILLIDCPDRKGLVAAVSTFLYEHGANILHADQHQDNELGLFFMRVEWEMGGFDLDAAASSAPSTPSPNASACAGGCAIPATAPPWRFSSRATSIAWWTCCTAIRRANWNATSRWSSATIPTRARLPSFTASRSTMCR